MSEAIMRRYYQQYSLRLENQRRAAEAAPTDAAKPLLVRMFRKRFARKKDVRVVIGGEGGVGKSTLALVLSEHVNPSLYIDRPDEAVETAVCFTSREYLAGVRSLPSVYDPPADPLERSALDFDEPGQAWYHRSFMTEVNMILSKTMLGFRFKQYFTPLSVPTIDLLDVDALRLVNWLIWVSDQGIAEVYRVMVQKFGGRPWFKTVIHRLRFGTPRAKLWHAYEKKKFAVQEKLYEQYGKKLEDMDRPELSISEMVEKVKKSEGLDGRHVEYRKDGEIHYAKLMDEFTIGVNKAYLIKAKIESHDVRAEGEKDAATPKAVDPAELLRRLGKDGAV